MSTPGSGSLSARRAAAFDLAAGLPPAALVAWAFVAVAGAPSTQVAVTCGVYAAVALGILRWVPDRLPGKGLGPANRVTLGRLVLALPLVGMAAVPTSSAAAHWAVVVVGTLVLVLDGVDGRVARRTGTATPFGARFDMETDAALMMVLSVLVWQTGKVGAWVLAIGAMRYAFVAAAWLWPALNAPLPPSLRRKVVCVVQGVALVTAMGPIIPAPAAALLCAVALALLAWSFAVDVVWLVRASYSTAAPSSHA